ncbi:MAG: tetratricopeptide repeat protein [Candidatus Lindowbacteria bacterium]|nr:tetratricopeptide repeat protein [Candidatus Lindowbacteria bacterium]
MKNPKFFYRSLFGLIILTAVCSVPAFAQEWSEYRRVDVYQGDQVEIDLEDTGVFDAGNKSIVKELRGPKLVLGSSEIGSQTIIIKRNKLGPIEIEVFVHQKPKSKPKPAVKPKPKNVQSRPKRSPTSEPAPVDLTDIDEEINELQEEIQAQPKKGKASVPPRVEARRKNTWPRVPPISAAPPPLVLISPPGLNAEMNRFPQNSKPPSVKPPKGEMNERDRFFESITNPAQEMTPAIEPQLTTEDFFGAPLDENSEFEEIEVPTASNLPQDTSIDLDDVFATTDELSIYALANDLLSRDLFEDAISEYRRLIREFPRTKLRQSALTRIGYAFKEQGVTLEKEALRQRDMRFSGEANAAIDSSISAFGQAVDAYKSAIETVENELQRGFVQLSIAQSLHGVVRAEFFKGSTSQESPPVVVAYLKSFIATKDSTVAAPARLGIANYYRDLGNARHLSNPKDEFSVRQAYERAVEEYEKVLQTAPRSFAAEEALFALGRLYDQNLVVRNFALAVKYYEQLSSRFPTSENARISSDRARFIRDTYL